MELILKNGLPHQDKGVLAVSNVFTDHSFDKNNLYYANPTLDLNKEILLESIKEVQKNNSVHPEYTGLNGISSYLNLDIKMETGTGKTYVHTAAIFELHKRFKVNKFIIVANEITTNRIILFFIINLFSCLKLLYQSKQQLNR